jgi:N-acetyl sugar amidotransferase
MDTSVPDIEFDEKGECQYCRKFETQMKTEVHDDAEGQRQLDNLVAKIKRRGVGKKYDCLIGISGGVDSTYVAYLLRKKYDLRPLAVHLDNGWNTELAVANVEQALRRLNIDLSTYVLDWEEFRDLQVSFLKSSISNIEIPTDHAIWALLIKTAAKHNIPYIIGGNNVATEAIMPTSWLYPSKDSRLIHGIQKRFGTKKLKTYPSLTTMDYVNNLLIRGIKWIPILNYIKYVKSEAKETLMKELGWRDYGGKHYESIYTRFFHAYYLPEKFGYDLRRAYDSALVVSGQMTRAEGLKELEAPTADSDVLRADKEFVQKKLRLSDREFDEIMKAPPKMFSDYPNNDALWRRFSGFVASARTRITKAE